MQFHCPHCGALYEKSDAKSSGTEETAVHCVVCKHVMHHSPGGRTVKFKLIRRPESDTH